MRSTTFNHNDEPVQERPRAGFDLPREQEHDRAALTRARRRASLAARLFSCLDLLGSTSSALAGELETAKPGSEFRDCERSCPTMVVIPAGIFAMGSSSDDVEGLTSERPRREARIADPIAVSKFETTFEEWDACVAAGACPHTSDSWGRGRMPVIDVSWKDAEQYVAWLSGVTGKGYRLPTEAEWEYAARAGAASRYSWGDDPGRGAANCDGCGSRWDLRQTAPVGSFKPNAFGLCDMHGNVWEWVEDSWHDTYLGAPSDGSAWVQDADPRTGSSVAAPGATKPRLAAVREKRHFDTLGFRVARTFDP